MVFLDPGYKIQLTALVGSEMHLQGELQVNT